MREEPEYTVAVLKEDVKHIRQTLEEVREQAVLTNGRIKRLEIWKAWIFGFCACISVVLLPVVFYALTRFLDALQLT